MKIKLNHHLLKRKKRERIISIIALLVLITAWIAGRARLESDIYPFIQQLYPNSNEIEKLPGGNYIVWEDSNHLDILGYISLGVADGYGGPMRLAVSTDPSGNVTQMLIIEHKETPSFLLKVVNSGFFESLTGKSFSDQFSLQEDVDGITGATYTSRAIADSVRFASVSIAVEELGATVPKDTPPKINFGVLEITLILLFAVGYFAHKSNFPYKKQGRWVSMIIGLFVVGFIFNSPLTLASISKFLLGFWPEWQTNLHWYILLLGIIFVFTVDNKNPYCDWFCPFGAAQECMGALGGAKARANKNQKLFTWILRIFVFMAIVLALYFQNPSMVSYEIFGTLFNLTGTNAQFILLGLVLIFSLFIKRPWCKTLCPITPIVDFIRVIRGWIKDLWKRKKI